MTALSDAPQLPRGWRRQPLGEICEVQAGGPLLMRVPSDVGDPVVVVQPADVRGERVTTGKTILVPPNKTRGLGRYRLAPDDILVTRSGTVGRAALVTGGMAGAVYNTHLLRLRPHDSKQAAYLVSYLSRPGVSDWMLRRASGSAIKSITPRVLAELPVLLPPPKEQETIGATLAALNEKIRAHEDTARATADLRDSLADLLMTGQLSPGPQRRTCSYTGRRGEHRLEE